MKINVVYIFESRPNRFSWRKRYRSLICRGQHVQCYQLQALVYKMAYRGCHILDCGPRQVIPSKSTDVCCQFNNQFISTPESPPELTIVLLYIITVPWYIILYFLYIPSFLFTGISKSFLIYYPVKSRYDIIIIYVPSNFLEDVRWWCFNYFIAQQIKKYLYFSVFHVCTVCPWRKEHSTVLQSSVDSSIPMSPKRVTPDNQRRRRPFCMTIIKRRVI